MKLSKSPNKLRNIIIEGTLKIDDEIEEELVIQFRRLIIRKGGKLVGGSKDKRLTRVVKF